MIYENLQIYSQYEAFFTYVLIAFYVTYSTGGRLDIQTAQLKLLSL